MLKVDPKLDLHTQTMPNVWQEIVLKKNEWVYNPASTKTIVVGPGTLKVLRTAAMIDLRIIEGCHITWRRDYAG